MTSRVYQNWDNPPDYYDFSPKDAISIGDGGFWWDFGDWNVMYTDLAMTTKVTAAGQAVAAVKDKGPNGFHLQQSDLASRPIATVQNGFKCLDFTPGQFMATPVDQPMANATHHGWIIFETDTTPTFMRLVSVSTTGTDTATANGIAIHSGDLNYQFGVRARTASGLDTKVGGTGVSPLGLYEYDLQGAVASVWKDNAAGTGDASASGQTQFTAGRIFIGCQSNLNDSTTTGQLDGRVWNILHCGTIPNTATQTKIETWLNTNRF